MLPDLLVLRRNTSGPLKFESYMDQGLGLIAANAINTVAAKHQRDWQALAGDWQTDYVDMTGEGLANVRVLVSMNGQRQGLNFLPYLGELTGTFISLLKGWVLGEAPELKGEDLTLAVDWQLRPAAGAVLNLRTGMVFDHYLPER